MLLKNNKYTKKEGSLLIEVMASIAILTLSITFIISANIENFKIIKARILAEEINRSVYNLINEIKYNISKEHIEELLSDGEIGFSYDKEFSKDLLSKEIDDFNRGEEIKIIMIGEDEIGLRLKIEANIKREENEINIGKEFNKSWWMDEI